MRRLYPDLWQTAQQKQFSTLNVHGYLLERPEGNALFYNPEAPATSRLSPTWVDSTITT